MKVALFGAVRASMTALTALANAAGDELRVFCLAASKAARHSDFVDLAPLAAARGVSATAIEDINAPSTLAAVREFAPDIVCIFGWSQLVRAEFLAIPRLGVLGWHPAMLPKNRGRAVIPWTILQGIPETGFTIFWINEGMDSGDIAAQVRVEVSPDETAATLYQKMETAAAAALNELVPAILAGTVPQRPQRHEDATYCARRDREDGRIDWTQSAELIARLVRASGDPYPGAFTDSRLGELVVDVASVDEFGRYWGVPGQVQWIDNGGAVVACGQRTTIRLQVVHLNGQPSVPAQSLLRIHEHLGARVRRQKT